MVAPSVRNKNPIAKYDQQIPCQNFNQQIGTATRVKIPYD
jgi:hypothetical protein